MTQVHFTLNSEEAQSIIEHSVKDNTSKDILATVFNQLMGNQRTEYIQADDRERSESRQSQRSGYYERDFTTRVGTLELRVSKTRDGEFSPTVFERCRRNEKALLASVPETYVPGVSTRKVSEIVEELCGKSVSKSFVSSLAEQLDPMANEQQNRSLSGTNYPYLMADILYIRVRGDHRVPSKNCHIAIGIIEGGDRETTGFMIQNEENGDTWSILSEYSKEHDPKGAELIISGAHRGLASAIHKSFINVSWQRCQVHFLGNISSFIPEKNLEPFRGAVKVIFKFTDIELAQTTKNALIGECIDQPKYTKARGISDNGSEDAFQYAVTGNSHNRLKSTNPLERLNQEVRRRGKIIRIFPNRTSANRLTGAAPMDLHGEWLSPIKKYIKFDQ